MSNQRTNQTVAKQSRSRRLIGADADAQLSLGAARVAGGYTSGRAVCSRRLLCVSGTSNCKLNGKRKWSVLGAGRSLRNFRAGRAVCWRSLAHR